MTRPLTRRQLLERAALGGAALTLPGFLAACGGGDGGTAAATTAGGGSGQLASQLRFANWQLYIDVDEKTKKRPTLDQFTKRDRRLRRLLRGDQLERRVLREDPGAALARPGDRPRHHRPDRQLALSGADGRGGVGRGARQERDPEHRQPRRGAQEAALRPRPHVLAALAVRDDRDRLQREADLDADHLDRPAARGLEAEGEDHAALRDGRHARRRDEGERRRPVLGHGRLVQERDRPRQGGRRLGPGAPVHRQRLLRPALEGRSRSPRSRGRATSSSCRRTTRT